MGLNTEASAALVYLILYTILFVILAWQYTTKRLHLRSRYTVVFFNVVVRLASQATGLAFGVVGYENTNLLVAYFILGAEGYFTLVLCTYRFLISWQYHNSASHNSWLEPRYPPGTSNLKKFYTSFALFGPYVRPMSIIHNILIAANAIIVTGGSQLAGGANSVQEFNSQLTKAKAMRVAGQAIFLSLNVFLLLCVLHTIRECKREKTSGAVHPTLWLLLASWPFLFVRGIYGVLSAVLPAFNYFEPDNYTADGLSKAFVVSEYILGTTMEWVPCALLMLTYVTSRNDPKKVDLEELHNQPSDSERIAMK